MITAEQANIKSMILFLSKPEKFSYDHQEDICRFYYKNRIQFQYTCSFGGLLSIDSAIIKNFMISHNYEFLAFEKLILKMIYDECGLRIMHIEPLIGT